MYGSVQVRQSIEILYTSNPIPTSFFQTGHPSKLRYLLTGNSIEQLKKRKNEKDVGIVFLCSVLLRGTVTLPYIYNLVCVLFGNAIIPLHFKKYLVYTVLARY